MPRPRLGPTASDRRGVVKLAVVVPICGGHSVSFGLRRFVGRAPVRRRGATFARSRGGRFITSVFVVTRCPGPDGRELVGVQVLEEKKSGSLDGVLAGREPTAREKAEAIVTAGKILAATRRARRLLIEALSLGQKAELVEHGWFTVQGPSGRSYRVGAGPAGNVIQLDRRARPYARFCVHTPTWMPDEDLMLAQKLRLESDEASLRSDANISPLRRARPRKLTKILGWTPPDRHEHEELPAYLERVRRHAARRRILLPALTSAEPLRARPEPPPQPTPALERAERVSTSQLRYRAPGQRAKLGENS